MYTERMFDHGTTITFKNSKYITPVTFELFSDKKIYQINVFDKDKNTFVKMMKINYNAKLITSERTILLVAEKVK